MKTVINYFKKRQDERLRTKIALKTGHSVNDLQTVYEFIKGGTVAKTGNGVSMDGIAARGFVEVPELKGQEASFIPGDLSSGKIAFEKGVSPGNHS